MSKFIFITGGVVSGLGKGLTASALGRLLKERGYSVNIQKFDPYFNVDSMYLSPYQQGEIFVTHDGGEVDPVIGHYERFLDQNLSEQNEITSGKIYSTVISNERAGKYSGHTVQVVPHITDEIKKRIFQFNKAGDDSHIIISEIGGTVGDIECHPFLEAIRQSRADAGRGNVAYIHVTMLPYISMSGEQKTKPTQNSVKELQNLGIQPDAIVCRTDYSLDSDTRRKLSLFCNVPQSGIIESITTQNRFGMLLNLEKEGLAGVVLAKLKLEDHDADLSKWQGLADKFNAVKKNGTKKRIALVGKYTEKPEAYQSLTEALVSSGILYNTDVIIENLSSESIDAKSADKLSGYDGVVIPSGFGARGFEGKIAAADFCRINDIPCLMIGMGAQAGITGFARAAGFEKADSEEFYAKLEHPVVAASDTFKRGASQSDIKKGTQLYKIYGSETISERHRHKYHINPEYTKPLEEKGITFSAFADAVPEAYELKENKFFIGVIFRPEFKSRPLSTHPLFNAFIKACKR